jgi:hypothetical protein
VYTSVELFNFSIRPRIIYMFDRCLPKKALTSRARLRHPN